MDLEVIIFISPFAALVLTHGYWLQSPN